jgi:heme A synthase
MPKSFARYAWAVLAYNLGVVLWGGFVRATGSGAGCGNHWPLCNGTVTQHSPSAATIIEFTHRATSGLDLALVGLLVIWAFRRFPRQHPVRLGATLSALFLLTEALIGAALVLLQQVARNASVSRAYALSTHLINTLTLLACLTLTAWWSTERPAPKGVASASRVWMAVVSLASVVVLGVSGAIAALGDTLFPASSLAAGLAQDLDPAAHVFLRLRLLHPLIAAAVAAWLLFYAVSSASRRLDVAGQAWSLVALLAAQIAAGVVNLLLLAPVWMQLVHLLLADLLWITLVLLSAAILKFQPRPADPSSYEMGVDSTRV